MRVPLVVVFAVLALVAGYVGGQLHTTPASAAPMDARISDVVRQLQILHTDLGRPSVGGNGVNATLYKMTRQLNEVCRSLSHMDSGLSINCA